VVSYGALSAAIEGRAASLGVERGSLVRVGVAPTFEGIVSLLAVHHAGAVPMVVPGHVAPEMLGEAPEAMIVVPTSGSSGEPRPVPLTEENVAAAVTSSADRLGSDENDTWLLCLPLHHVGGLSVLWRSFAAGGGIVIVERFDAAVVAAVLAGEATTASLVPTMLRRVLAHGGRFGRVRALLLGGGPASPGLVAEGVAAGLPVLTTYGMTEAASQVTTVVPGQIEDSLGTAGRPLRGMEVTIADDGEILVDGPAVFPGYLGGQARVGPHRTGDVGRFDDAGRLVVSGRRDEVVVTGGENVHPAQVEAVLETHPAVVRVAVVGIPSDEWGMELVAAVEGDAVGEELRRWARERLSSHQVPKRILVTADLPTLPSGKVDRAAVRGLLGGRS
jgi:O-succinylbenzoic acid--CoA ligase